MKQSRIFEPALGDVTGLDVLFEDFQHVPVKNGSVQLPPHFFQVAGLKDSIRDDGTRLCARPTPLLWSGYNQKCDHSVGCFEVIAGGWRLNHGKNLVLARSSCWCRGPWLALIPDDPRVGHPWEVERP